MDYLSFPEDWSGRLRVRVLTITDIENTLLGIATWGPEFHPPGLAEHLEAGRRVAESLEESPATIHVVNAPGGMTIDIGPPP
jgi:hypothetical protein